MRMMRLQKVDRESSSLLENPPTFDKGTLVVLDGGQALVVGDGLTEFLDLPAFETSNGTATPPDGQT